MANRNSPSSSLLVEGDPTPPLEEGFSDPEGVKEVLLRGSSGVAIWSSLSSRSTWRIDGVPMQLDDVDGSDTANNRI